MSRVENQVIHDYTVEKLNLTEVRKKHGIGQGRLDRILRENNIPKRTRAEDAIYKRIRGKWSYEEVEKKVLDNYVNKQMGQLASGREFGLGQGNIEHILDSNNIKRRNFAEAASVSNIHRRAFASNDDYFKTQSANMAWILGFIAADGTIRKNSNSIKITLARKDREMLEKIREELEIEKEVKDYQDNKGYDSSTLEWTSQEHKKDLAKYSIVPAKTFILEWPHELERKYWIDYIRGYFDGDGSINLVKNSNGRGEGNLRWQVMSATRPIIQNIIDFFEEEYRIPPVSVLEQQGDRLHPLYYMQYSSVSTRKIYNILYTPDSLYLKRKKDHYEYILSQVKPLNE